MWVIAVDSFGGAARRGIKGLNNGLHGMRFTDKCFCLTQTEQYDRTDSKLETPRSLEEERRVD